MAEADSSSSDDDSGFREGVAAHWFSKQVFRILRLIPAAEASAKVGAKPVGNKLAKAEFDLSKD